MPDDAEGQVKARDRAVRMAALAVDNLLIDNPDLRQLPDAARTRIIVTAALGYLIGHGLVTVAPAADWERWLSTDIPEHLRPDLADMLANWPYRRTP
jgi:hypothetical protein